VSIFDRDDIWPPSGFSREYSYWVLELE